MVPTAIHVAAALALDEMLLPALRTLREVLERRVHDFARLVKTGRTHLMDAMPLTVGQEMSGWLAQVTGAEARLKSVQPRLYALAQGGTAVGTGINARAQFGAAFARHLAAATSVAFHAEP